jgi:membrane peptidoglycan carboxypeptidase
MAVALFTNLQSQTLDNLPAITNSSGLYAGSYGGAWPATIWDNFMTRIMKNAAYIPLFQTSDVNFVPWIQVHAQKKAKPICKFGQGQGQGQQNCTCPKNTPFCGHPNPSPSCQGNGNGNGHGQPCGGNSPSPSPSCQFGLIGQCSSSPPPSPTPTPGTTCTPAPGAPCLGAAKATRISRE